MKALKGFRATDISLMVLLFFHAICAIITGTLLPQIIKEFSIDYATAGSIETLRSYAILFILVITVKLLRVVSAKTLFVLSRFGIAVGFVMSALSGNYSFFLAGVILAGLGAGFVESLIAQTITNLHQAENNTEKFFNAIQGVFSIAVILIPLLYGYAMEHGVTWRQIFLYTSIMPVVVAFILLFSDLPAVEAEEGGYSEALKAVFSKAAGRLLSIGIFVSAGIENMFYVWSATYISLYLHDNQQYAATGLAIFGLFMCLARFTTALLNGKKIAYYIMYIAQICGFTSAILLFTMEGIEIFYISLALAGICAGPMWPSITGLISDMEPGAKAGYFIIIALIGYIGYANAPLFMGLIGDLSGDLKNGFYILPVSTLILVFVISGLRKLAIKNGSYYK